MTAVRRVHDHRPEPRRHLLARRARHRPHLPHDRRPELRPRRDGHVLDLRRVAGLLRLVRIRAWPAWLVTADRGRSPASSSPSVLGLVLELARLPVGAHPAAGRQGRDHDRRAARAAVGRVADLEEQPVPPADLPRAAELDDRTVADVPIGANYDRHRRRRARRSPSGSARSCAYTASAARCARCPTTRPRRRSGACGGQGGAVSWMLGSLIAARRRDPDHALHQLRHHEPDAA